MSCWIHWLESVLSRPWLRLWTEWGTGLNWSTGTFSCMSKRPYQQNRSFLTLARDAELRNNFRKTIIELRLLKFAKLLAREVAQVGLPISWVRVDESNSTRGWAIK